MATQLSVTVVDPALEPSAPMWGDATEGWVHAAHDWAGTLSAAGVPLSALASAENDSGEGLLLLPDPDAHADLAARAQASGRPLLTGAPPAGTAARLAAVRDALGALVRPDMRGVLVLRLDDPGAAVREHLDGWRHPPVPDATWDAMWDDLRGFGRVSLFCCPAWVEADGTVVDSRTRNPAEWAAVDRGVAEGLADLECHGFTHLHPDLDRWAAAPDRSSNPAWFRELWPPEEPAEPPADEQAGIIARWQAACGPCSTLVAPGEGWGTATLAAARARGLALFCSWGICRLDLPAPAWSRGIGSPYLDEADPSFLAEGLPAVGYWHDRDMALHGPGWVREHLGRWRDAGVTRAWAFADLARVYATPVEAWLDGGEVRVERAPDVPLLIERRG